MNADSIFTIDVDGCIVDCIDSGQSGYISCKEAPKAYLQFCALIVDDERIFEILHVYVPKKMRGRGIAESLCHFALTVAATSCMRIRPTCTYVRDTFMPRHPDLFERFVSDTSP